jgi:protein O-GlcNAc transferase
MPRKSAVGGDPLAGLDSGRLSSLLGDAAQVEPEKEAPEGAPEPPKQKRRGGRRAGGPRAEPAAGQILAAKAQRGEGMALDLPAASADEALNRARRLRDAGSWRESRGAFQEALQIDPANLAALSGLADLHAQRGDHRSATELLIQAQELAPDDVEVAIRLGREQGRLTAYADAETTLGRALRLESQNAAARAELGIVLAKKGLYAAAIEELQRALDLDPRLARAQHHLGVCFNQLDRLDAAAESFERAVAAAPDDDRAHYHLGIVYDRKGMTEQARAMYRRARELAEKRGRG